MSTPRAVTVQRFLVTGCGRSGTGYTAKLFGDLGLLCGHETVFRPLTDQRAGFGWPVNLPGESSWLGAPFLKALPKGTIVLHQVREPVAVIRSFLRIRFFDEPSVYLRFAETHVPELAAGDRVERCMRYWLRWNELAERGAELMGPRYFRYRLEDIDAALVGRVLALVGYPCAPERVERAVAERPRDYNSRGDKEEDPDVTWETLPRGELRDRLAELASRYGYEGLADDGTLAVKARAAAASL
jgi:hypothetical protein